jgi:hypothetical protein
VDETWQSNSRLELEDFNVYVVEPDIDNTPPAAACLDALFGQIKWARSIENFKIHLFPSDEVPMFDMQQFVASHKRLEHLRIIARHFNTGPS